MEFEKWLDKKYDESYHVYFINWNEFPFSFQFGVYQNFFDEKGILISVEHTRSFDYRFIISEERQPIKMDVTYNFDFVTLDEARESSIKKANEIFNN